MVYSQKVKDYIEQRKDLFWYSPAPKHENVKSEQLVETILNYGSWQDVQELFSVFGIKNVAKIFFSSINKSERRKSNYFEPVANYFTLYFNRYAH